MANKQNKTANKPVRKKRATKKEKPLPGTPYTLDEWNKKTDKYFQKHKPNSVIAEVAGTLKAGNKTLKQLMSE